MTGLPSWWISWSWYSWWGCGEYPAFFTNSGPAPSKDNICNFLFYQNQKRSQTGLVLTWRVGEPFSCKRQRIRSSLSLSPQFFSDLHHKGILYLLHNERDLMWFHCNPKLSFKFFGFRLYYFWSTCCHGSCWKLFNLCCQQLIPLFKSSSKYNHNALYFAVLYHLHLN